MATPEQAKAVIATMLDRACSLRSACGEHGVAISSFLWLVERDPAISDQYTHARAVILDARAEELEDIGERASRAESAVEVNGLRLLSDNRKWLLSKLAAKKYGDKLQLGGAHDLPPIGVAQSLTDDQLAAIAAKQGSL